jgi:hypothetical protein
LGNASDEDGGFTRHSVLVRFHAEADDGFLANRIVGQVSRSNQL